jgi:hypothetical protein
VVKFPRTDKLSKSVKVIIIIISAVIVLASVYLDFRVLGIRLFTKPNPRAGWPVEQRVYRWRDISPTTDHFRIFGKVFLDTNTNGINDMDIPFSYEEGIAGAKIEIWKSFCDRQIDLNQPPLYTGWTNQYGEYSIDVDTLKVGVFYVAKETPPKDEYFSTSGRVVEAGAVIDQDKKLNFGEYLLSIATQDGLSNQQCQSEN